MKYYELMMVVVPQIDDEGLSATLEKVNNYVSERGGSVVRQERWGRQRRLAYPIKSHNEGNYVLTHLEMETQHVKDLESSLILSDDVLRHLLVRIDAIPEKKEEPVQATAETTATAPPEPSQAEEGAPQEASAAVATDEPAMPAEDAVAVTTDEPDSPAEDAAAVAGDERAVQAEDAAAVATDEPDSPAEDAAAVATDEPDSPAEDAVAVATDEPDSPAEDAVAVATDEEPAEKKEDNG